MKMQIDKTLKDKKIHLIGIKGTGMTALVEILLYHGATVTGSDVPDIFYTDKILKELGITVQTEFSSRNISTELDWIIYSSAYSRENHPELVEAQKLALPISSYPQALGMISQNYYSVGVAGIHGKTTSTAILGRLCQVIDLPATILVGSQVRDFNDRCTCFLGDDFFIAETCEYQENFLHFFPSIILLTSIELDHPDYFTSIEHVKKAFLSYITKLPSGGSLVYCTDDQNVVELVEGLKSNKIDINFIPYGEHAEGDFQIDKIEQKAGLIQFKIKGINQEFQLNIPGRHNILNSTGALAVIKLLAEKNNLLWEESVFNQLNQGLAGFHGTKRRGELIGNVNNIIIMDDYAHHPTAIKTTLKGIKSFYSEARLVVDFMPHTYSRTEALFSEFAQSFELADVVLLHKIYASAREKISSEITGLALAEETRNYKDHVFYFDEFNDTVGFLEKYLQPGDIFVTMGAGDNWKIGYQLYQKLGESSK